MFIHYENEFWWHYFLDLISEGLLMNYLCLLRNFSWYVSIDPARVRSNFYFLFKARRRVLFVTVSFTDLAVGLLPFLVRMSVRQPSLAPPPSCLWTRHGSDHWHCLGWRTIRSLREFKGVMSACLWGTFLSSVCMKEKNYRTCMKFIPSYLIKCNWIAWSSFHLV